MDLPQIAGYGTDAIGLALGGWYTSDKIVKLNRKVDTRLVAPLLVEPPSAAAPPSGLGPIPGPSSVGPVGDTGVKDDEPERESYLGSFSGNLSCHPRS